MRYQFRHPRPYAHQREGVVAALRAWGGSLGYAFLFEPRTGKTRTAVDTICAGHLKFGIRKVLVVAPNRVLGVWIDQIASFTPPGIRVQTIVWDARARRKPIPRHDAAYDIQVLIVNYEAFGTQGRKLASGRRSRASGRFRHRSLIERWLGNDVAAIVCDESHRLKNPSGKAANMIVGMRSLFDYHLILTGTPITKAKRAADIYMQWRLINPARFASWGSTYEEFKNHTGVWTSHDGIDLWRRPRAKGMRDLQRGIHADGMVKLRDDCLDLPARLPDRIIEVRLSPRTGRHYDEMAEQFVTQLESGEIAEAAIPLVVTLRLMQITGGHVGIREPSPVNPDKMVSRSVRIGTEKLAALKALLVEEFIETDEPVIICARFKAELDAIQKLCTALGVPWWSVRGGMTRQASDAAVAAFKRADGVRAMVVQPAAGGVGIDLASAHQMVWFSLVSSWVDYTQMCDRIALADRGNQHTFLLARGTVDHVVYQGLQEDTDVTRMILTKPQVILRG